MSPDAAACEQHPDPVEAVARLEAAVTKVTEDVKALAHGVAQEVDELWAATEVLQQAAGQGAPAGAAETTKAPGPRPWGQRATVEDWHTLVEWVDWLSATYDTINARRIAPCWPVHGGLVHELAAVRSAWLSCAATPEPDDALAYWHDRLLWPLLMRLDCYRISACLDGHKDVRPAQLTDQDILEQVLDDVPPALDHHADPAADPSTGEVL